MKLQSFDWFDSHDIMAPQIIVRVNIKKNPTTYANVGYEMIIANLALRASLAIYHLLV